MLFRSAQAEGQRRVARVTADAAGKADEIDVLFIVDRGAQLAVRLSDYGNVILSLTDSMGRVVYRRNVVESDSVVPTGALSSGIYILAVNNNGMIETRKIILN